MRWKGIRFICDPMAAHALSALSAPAFALDLPVRFAETDAMGVVHHSAYVIWMEAARVAWMEAAGVPYAEIAAGGYHFSVTGLHGEYRAPARFGEHICVDPTGKMTRIPEAVVARFQGRNNTGLP